MLEPSYCLITIRPFEEQVTLRDEAIHVDRRPVNRTLSSADSDLFSEKTYEITDIDEEAVVAKDARVVVEIVVGKKVETRTKTVRASVRRADVEIKKFSTDYGEVLANDARYEGLKWREVERGARTNYERDNQDGEP